jgi:hypothetical protein
MSIFDNSPDDTQTPVRRLIKDATLQVKVKHIRSRRPDLAAGHDDSDVISVPQIGRQNNSYKIPKQGGQGFFSLSYRKLENPTQYLRGAAEIPREDLLRRQAERAAAGADAVLGDDDSDAGDSSGDDEDSDDEFDMELKVRRTERLVEVLETLQERCHQSPSFARDNRRTIVVIVVTVCILAMYLHRR